MKRFSIIVILLSLIIFNKICAVNLDFSGYIYNNISYQKIDDSFKNIDTSIKVNEFVNELFRVRFKPELEISENTRITANYEISGVINKILLPFYYSTEKTNRQLVDLNWQLSNKKIGGDLNLFVNHYIDMLYLKQFFDWGEIVVGRQVISWGVGRVWQPTDLFNPINPANFSKIERDGTDAISSKIYIGDFTDFEIVVNFREIFKQNNYGVRFRTNYEGYDLSIMSGYFDESVVIGSDFAGNLFDAGVRGEILYSNDLDNNDFIRFIVGADYQITADLYALIEYQHNGFGTKNKKLYLSYFEKLLKGEIQNLAQDYLAIISSYQIHPLISSNLTIIRNLNDNSMMAGLTLNYNAMQDLNLGLGFMGFLGSDYSEYSYYPTALYLTTEWYF